MLRLPIWSERLDNATSIEEVLSVVRDFLSRWQPSELAELGTDRQPGRMTTPVAVADYAVGLTQDELKAGPFAPNSDKMKGEGKSDNKTKM